MGRPLPSALCPSRYASNEKSMKTHHIFHILAISVLIQFAGNGSLIAAQLPAQNMAQEHIIELEHNCTLAFDLRLDPKDTLTHEIEYEIRQVMSSIQALIPANDLTIYIVLCDTTNVGNIIPFMGIGGHPMGTDAVRMYIQPENPNFKAKYVAWGLPHEIHHVIRMRKPGWHWSLLECIVMEGLADHFLVEVTGSEAGPWTRALSEEDIENFLIKFRSHMHTTTESWDEFEANHLTPWLFGRSGSDSIPSFTGYSLGWRIVENYINAHPEASGSSLLYVSSEVIAESTPELLVTE